MQARAQRGREQLDRRLVETRHRLGSTGRSQERLVLLEIKRRVAHTIDGPSKSLEKRFGHGQRLSCDLMELIGYLFGRPGIHLLILGHGAHARYLIGGDLVSQLVGQRFLFE